MAALTVPTHLIHVAVSHMVGRLLQLDVRVAIASWIEDTIAQNLSDHRLIAVNAPAHVIQMLAVFGEQTLIFDGQTVKVILRFVNP